MTHFLFIWYVSIDPKGTASDMMAGDDFMCSSGFEYISSLARCDHIVDCYDFSDEIGCQGKHRRIWGHTHPPPPSLKNEMSSREGPFFLSHFTQLARPQVYCPQWNYLKVPPSLRWLDPKITSSYKIRLPLLFTPQLTDSCIDASKDISV